MDIAQTKITICNAVLTKHGQNTIASLSDGTPEATIMLALYAQVLDDQLGRHMWTFAQKAVLLTTLAITPVDFGDGATIVYAFPSDYIKVNFWNYPYALTKVMYDGIHSDTPGLAMSYTYRNDDPTKYTPQFIQALIARLVAETCVSFTNSAVKKADAWVEAKEKLDIAIASDSQSGSPTQAMMDEWFAVRLAGSSAVPGVGGGGNIGFGA